MEPESPLKLKADGLLLVATPDDVAELATFLERALGLAP